MMHGYDKDAAVAFITRCIRKADHPELAEDIPALLETRDRRLTGPTMPPQGLYMHRIWYDGPAGEMMADT